MKKIIFITVLLFTSSIFAQFELTQQSSGNSFEMCLTPSNSSNFSELETIRGLDHSNDTFYVKIYIHVLRDDVEPKHGQSIEGVNRILKTLRSDFDPLGVHFVWDGYIDYIDNNAFYKRPDLNSTAIFNTNNHQDGIDIYLGDDLDSWGMGAANGIGESTELLLSGYFYGYELTPLSHLKFVSHLMGHVLFLWKTHHGSPYINDGGCPEFVDGTNGTTCGDYISDTPADPNLFVWNTNHQTCEFEPEQWPVGEYYDVIPPVDPNGKVYQPDPTNLMSLTYFPCWDSFTNGQKSRMKNALWYLPVLNQTILENYVFISPDTDCYICDDQYFKVYSSYDLNSLYPISSTNIETEIIEQTSEYLTIKVTNLIGNVEGERGNFSIVRAGHGIIEATQPIWVGLPQTVPDNTFTGSETAFAGQGVFHRVDNRLDGIENYGWDVPEPSQIIWGGEPVNNELWSHYGYDKYFFFSSAYAGNQTGKIKTYGINPCGDGDSGDFNEICVVNSDDPEGDTECDPLPSPIYYYPNPAGSLLQIDLSLQPYKIFDVVIYDENQTVKYSDQSENVVKTVDTFNLTNGTYYLHIYDGSDLILSAILIINH